MRAEPLRVGDAVQRDRLPVSGRRFAVRLVLLDRSKAVRRRRPGQVAEVARRGAAAGAIVNVQVLEAASGLPEVSLTPLAPPTTVAV